MVLENVRSHQSHHIQSIYSDQVQDDSRQPDNNAGVTSIKSRENILLTSSSSAMGQPSSSSSAKKEDGVQLEIKELDDYETSVTEEPLTLKQKFVQNWWPKIKPWFHLFLACFFTSWWISILAQPRHRPHWLIPTFVYAFIMLRFIFWYIPSSAVVKLLQFVWKPSVNLLYKLIPLPKYRLLGAFGCVLTVHVLSTFIDAPKEGSSRLDRFISFIGYWICVAIFYITSRNRSLIDWKLVLAGIMAQFLLGLFILRTKAGQDLFIFLARLAQTFLRFAKAGSTFLFSEDLLYNSGYFTMNIFPAVMFFSSTVYILSYIGWIQWIVRKVSTIFTWGMNLSGMEATVASATPFIGSIEATILMKPYVPFATTAEFHIMNAVGFSTISGGAIVSYSSIGLNVSALLTAAIMSVPLSIALARLRFPEEETQITLGGNLDAIDPEELQKGQEKLYNIVHAFSLGSWTGIQISLAMFTNLLCINATVTMIDLILSWFGRYWGIPELTSMQIAGYFFYPFSFFLGVSRPDVYKISKLLGTKLMYNEFIAYEDLLATVGLSRRSQMLATYVLCSYANFGTLAEKIAILVRLAPDKIKAITGTVWSSLLTGFMASFLTACFAGCITNNVSEFSVTAVS